MKNIFDEFGVNPLEDPSVSASKLILYINNHPEEFKKVSDRAVELGVVERLSPSGYVQAIQNLAHQMFTLSLGMNLKGLPMEEDTSEYYRYDGLGDDMRQLDKIFNMIAFASGKHWDEVSIDLDRWMAYYTDKFVSNLPNQLN